MIPPNSRFHTCICLPDRLHAVIHASAAYSSESSNTASCSMHQPLCTPCFRLILNNVKHPKHLSNPTSKVNPLRQSHPLALQHSSARSSTLIFIIRKILLPSNTHLPLPARDKRQPNTLRTEVRVVEQVGLDSRSRDAARGRRGVESEFLPVRGEHEDLRWFVVWKSGLGSAEECGRSGGG
jgi:hypothetical protein